MHQRRSYLSIIIFCISLPGICQTTTVAERSKLLFDVIATNHYTSPGIDDSSSSFIFDSFLETLDPGGMFFIKEDIEKFEAYRYSIDDDVKFGKMEFFSLFAETYKTRLNAALEHLDEIEQMEFDFLKDEKVNFGNGEIYKPSASEEELKDKWRLWAKYSILEEIFDYDYLENPTEAPLDSLLQHVNDARDYVFKDERFYIKNFLENPNGFESYLGTFYLDAIASSFDPHSSYFSPVEKQKFQDDLSRGNFEFGFSLVEDKKGVITISSLIPGSPAWNCNQLNSGDQLISVELKGEKKIDLRKKSLDDFKIIMINTDPETVVLKIVKANGIQQKVELTKGEIYVEEDVIKSVILEGEKKIGYITLPDFYTDWEDEGTLGCANDIAKVILKLQKENIQGLVLDFRNNGGGSLREAIDLAGIFIDWGPLTVFKEKGEKPYSIKDLNKGSIYNGPLLILVNSLSASATEIFAAAMQDYNRALIVGSATYGKATGQVVLRINALSETDGFVKVTTSKFYRINNGTHQKVGVQPDVNIRDIYELYDYSESTYTNALVNDSVIKKLYFTPMAEFNSGELSSKSQARMNRHSNFQRLTFVLDSLQESSIQRGNVSLNILDYQQSQKEFERFLGDLFDEDSYSTEIYRAVNNQFDQKILQLNEYRKELNQEYLKRIESDLYIEEAYNILLDQIRLSSN